MHIALPFFFFGGRKKEKGIIGTYAYHVTRSRCDSNTVQKCGTAEREVSTATGSENKTFSVWADIAVNDLV